MPHQTSDDMREVMRDDAPSQATIFRRTAELQQGRQSAETEQLCGRLIKTCMGDFWIV